MTGSCMAADSSAFGYTLECPSLVSLLLRRCCVAMCIDQALVVELVQDAHLVLGLVHVDAYVVMVAL